MGVRSERGNADCLHTAVPFLWQSALKKRLWYPRVRLPPVRLPQLPAQVQTSRSGTRQPHEWRVCQIVPHAAILITTRCAAVTKTTIRTAELDPPSVKAPFLTLLFCKIDRLDFAQIAACFPKWLLIPASHLAPMAPPSWCAHTKVVAPVSRLFVRATGTQTCPNVKPLLLLAL